MTITEITFILYKKRIDPVINAESTFEFMTIHAIIVLHYISAVVGGDICVGGVH